MTDPSLQKMQTTPESNVQKMHIPAEWVEAGARAAAVANNDDPDFLGYQQNKPNWQLWSPCIEAALAAVIPMIEVRAADQERERLAKEAEEGIMVRAQISSEEFSAADAGHDVADWLRAQGRE